MLEELKQRFWKKVIKLGKNKCWVWDGNVNSQGYGRFYILGVRVQAHRVSYFLEYGYFPSDWHVDHLCTMKDCVNPEHLEAVPPEINRERVEIRRYKR